MRLHCHARLVLWLLVVAALAVTSTSRVHANMANPHQDGDPIGEPSGALEDVVVARETLLIDLRPLATGNPALVSATYEVRNAGPRRTLQLVFVAPSLMQQRARVSLDSAPLRTSFERAPELPASWKPPSTTPGLGGEGDIRYGVRQNDVLRFALALPPGSHRIEVSYHARPSTYSGNSPTRYWQLGYVLAPAREWAGFGGLDVIVQLPQSWRAASRPALTRSEGVLTGTFNGVPADTLALTVQAPAPANPDIGAFSWVLGCLALVLFAALAGWWLGRRRRSALWALPLSVILALGWAGLILVGYGYSDPARGVPSAQRAWNYGYRGGLAVMALALLALLAGAPLAQLVAWLAARLGRRRATGAVELAVGHEQR
ncbi:MAG: hypothetical protein M3281_08430 [Chloroflexota bacterium]|nr:hypothetical protein [Chloroflexota bacterium]